MPSKQKMISTRLFARWCDCTGDAPPVICVWVLVCVVYCTVFAWHCLFRCSLGNKAVLFSESTMQINARLSMAACVYTESPFHRISNRVTSGSASTLHLSRDTIVTFSTQLYLPFNSPAVLEHLKPSLSLSLPCNLEAREKDKHVFEW